MQKPTLLKELTIYDFSFIDIQTTTNDSFPITEQQTQKRFYIQGEPLHPEITAIDNENITLFRYRIIRDCDLAKFKVDSEIEGIVKAELFISNRKVSTIYKDPDGTLDFFGYKKLIHLFMMPFNEIYIDLYIVDFNGTKPVELKRDTFYITPDVKNTYLDGQVIQEIFVGVEVESHKNRPKSIISKKCVCMYGYGSGVVIDNN